MRERLIELLDNYGDDISLCDVCKRPSEDCEGCKNEQLAEFLLANGVIVLPCKVGDVVYALWETPTETKYVVYCAEVKEIHFCKKNNRLSTIYKLESIEYRGRIREYFDCDFDKLVFLFREEAEKALEGGKE